MADKVGEYACEGSTEHERFVVARKKDPPNQDIEQLQ
jgi:hypothetical protein